METANLDEIVNLMKLDKFPRRAYIEAMECSRRLVIEEISRFNKATNMKRGRF